MFSLLSVGNVTTTTTTTTPNPEPECTQDWQCSEGACCKETNKCGPCGKYIAYYYLYQCIIYTLSGDPTTTTPGPGKYNRSIDSYIRIYARYIFNILNPKLGVRVLLIW